MSWKMEVLVDGKWAPNGIAFATKEEAELAGRDLLARWYVPTDSRAVESDQPVNYEIVDGVQRPVDEAAKHRAEVAQLTQAEIDHADEEYRRVHGESERDAAVRDTNAVLELQSRDETE